MFNEKVTSDISQGKNFSHALTVFTIAATVACLFTPVFEAGLIYNLESISKNLENEKINLIEERNKLISQVNQLKTPESMYDIAVKKDYQLEMISTNL